MHRLLHITDDVEYFGLPLMKFEHFSLKIIAKVEASCLEEENLVCQLTKRLNKIDFIDAKSETNTKATVKPKDNFLLKKGIVFIHTIHSDGTYAVFTVKVF